MSGDCQKRALLFCIVTLGQSVLASLQFWDSVDSMQK